MRRAILTLLFAIINIGVTSAQDGVNQVSKSAIKNFDKGLAFYKDAKYEKALKHLYKAAVAGHAEAQFYMGGCYIEGSGVSMCEYEAVQWWRKAAEAATMPLNICWAILIAMAQVSTSR